MNKKRLWLIVLTVVMCLSFSVGLAACGEKDEYVSATQLQIANKAELQAEWFEDGEDRTVKLTLPPELAESDVRVTSNNPAVVLAEGKTLKAAGVGIAKITVFADDESDSVNITVKQALKEISITNKNELRKILINEERTVEFSVKPDAFDVASANVEILSGNTGVAAVDGTKIKAVGVGETTLTVKAGKYSDTVDVSVVNMANPTFGIADGAQVKGAVNSAIELPFAVLSCDGADLREHVEAVCGAGLTFDKSSMTVYAEKTGEYSVKMSVADQRNADMKASVEFTVNVYRKLFADYNGYGNIGYESYEDGKQFVADAEQVTSFDRWDATFASFDMQPSKTYYAELVIDSASKADWSTFYGMTHSVKGDATRWLTAYMDRGAAVTREPEEGEESRYYSGARDFRIKDVDILNDMDCWQLHQGNQPRTQILYSYGLNRFRGIDKTESFPCKLATARIGDFFYFFVNDDYVCAVTNEYLQGKDSVPGYFQQSGIKTDIKNIAWLTGTAAEAKFNALTDNGSKLFSEYAPGDWWKNENEASEHIAHSKDGEAGANYTFDTDALTGENKGIVTPYIFFDGNFTFEWEYQFAADSAAGNWDRFMSLEVRHLRDENSVWDSNYSNKYAFLFGGMRQNGSDGNDICAMVKCFSKEKPNDWDWERPEMAAGGKEWYSNSQKLKYSVTRICMENAAGKPFARYTFVIQRADGTERSEWTYDDYGLDKWNSPCEPVILLWKNKGVKGTYSNVRWSVPENSVTITNKAQLQKKWTVGEADRTVAVSIIGNMEGPATVTSSNAGVVSADGYKLTAVGRGTATITVKVGDYADKVEITVTPALESISISNKGALAAEWKLSTGGTREVEIGYSPSDVYNADNTNVTITSSNTDVITVEGYILTAVGAGRTTVTVSAGGLKDTVAITITTDKPVLSLENSSDVYGEVGGEITLPGYTVISVEGDEVEEPAVTVTCEGATVSDGKLTASQSGEYTVTYSYDGADEVTTTVYVYRKAVSSVFAEGDNVAVEYTQNADCIDDAKQTITLNTTKNTYAQFNMAAGKNFYAEATFVVAAQDGNQNFYGLYAADPTDTTRYLAAMTDRGVKTNEWERAVKIVDFDTTKDNWTDVSSTKFWCRNVFKYGQKITERAEDSVTIALARIDDIFYMLIDGQTVMGFTAEDYNGKDTVVGIFQKNAVTDTKITAMTYLSGDDAQTKLNALTNNGSKLFGEYRPNDWWDNENSAGDYISVSDDTSKGANFTFGNSSAGENAGIVAHNVNFEGDFTFEWEFKFAAGTTGGNGNKYMRVEVRTAEYSDWGVRLSATAQENGGNNLCIGANASRNEHSDLNGVWLKDEGYAKQYKFAISRVCGTDGNANYRFQAWRKDGDGYVSVYDRYLLGTQFNDFGAPDAPAIIVIKTVNVAGEYTNIKWSIPEKWNIPDSRVEISDKTALTQRWIVGTEEREIGVTVNPNLFGYYTITSSAPEVVAVEGNKLKALAAGTATVTLTAGNKTDSVEITVIPVLSDISISNKEVLSAAWKLSDGGTREIGIAFTPAEHYNAENTDVEITSSNTGVITVSGTTLTPVGIGRTTVTVKVGDKSDTIQITVTGDKPALSLNSSADIYGVEGSEITLPGFTVISVEGDEVENPDVTITCDNATVSDGKLTAGQTGEYTITYSYDGADDATVTVYVHRKLFANLPETVTYVNDKENLSGNGQKANIAVGTNYAPFDMTPSKYYYAEVTYTGTASESEELLFGMSHSVLTDGNRYIAALYDRSASGLFKVKEINKSDGNWAQFDPRTSETPILFAQEVKSIKGTNETGVLPITFAVIRMKDMFYTFINGQYIMGFSNKYFGSLDTVAGICVGSYKNWSLADSSIQSVATGITWVSGETETTAKFNEVTQNGKKLIGKFAPTSWWNVENTAQFTATETGFTYDEYESNSANKGIISPNVFFDGDFTVEWNYLSTSTNGNKGTWNLDTFYSLFEVRGIYRDDWEYKIADNAAVSIGANRMDNNTEAGQNVFSLVLNKTDNKSGDGGQWYNLEQPIKYKVTRVCENDSAKYTLSMSYADGTNPASWEFTIAEMANERRPSDPVMFLWKNKGTAGEYTNIKWTASAEQN